MQAMQETSTANTPGRAAVFGASGGIGGALVTALGAAGWRVAAGSRRGGQVDGAERTFTFDLEDEDSIAAAAASLRADPPALVIVATGALTLPGGRGPEKSLRQIDPGALASSFAINATGPALIAKHMLPLLPRDRRGVFAVLGARVGSIGDNRLGGWHAYRASKAALAMLIRCFAIEMARTHPQAVVCGLHPGTVDTPLSLPFQSGLPPGQLVAPPAAAANLIGVIDRLNPDDSGGIFDWSGARLPE